MTANSGMPSNASSVSKINSILETPLAGRIERQRVAHEAPAHQRKSNRNDHQYGPTRDVEKGNIPESYLQLNQIDAGRRQRHADQRGGQVHGALHPRLNFFREPVQQHVDLDVARLAGRQYTGQHGDPEHAGAHRVVGPDQGAVGEVAQAYLGQADNHDTDEDRAEKADFEVLNDSRLFTRRPGIARPRHVRTQFAHWASDRISSRRSRSRLIPGTSNSPEASISSSTRFEIRCHSRTSSGPGSTISMPCSSSAARASRFSSTLAASCSRSASPNIVSQIARCSGEMRSNALRSTAITPAVISTGKSSMYFARVCHCRMMAPDMVLANVLMVPVCSAV